ncbi:toxin TcdB middle/N-terminal domain-containing protein [Breznakiella homolactica]|uniref:Insecticide toxin TcdB middle/N-terminal domain-containing protein n=1 Tax=Breznakiella homolactica TaxID=2798577 RepID=A0A7T7XQM6_9SPIR|nr:toxin TcdB middle/N-terminal domain-containing protein [Breznakiella homolactica]QQO10706.1 hypothetical protein JFL75_07275 [Breznakiella homolactica]
MTGSRITAGILAVIYVGMLHPVWMYGETGPEPAAGVRLPGIVRESAAEVIAAEAGGIVRLGETEVAIPAGALERDTEIRITRLPVTEGTGEDLSNVTWGGGGYRFEPAGTQFKKAVQIRMAYDPGIGNNEESLENLYTYYYNTAGREWERLERVGLEEERHRIISETTHFTDMINGTITLPEGPGPLDFNINSIKNLEAANPGALVIPLDGLEGGSSGAAEFRLDVPVPSGRAGMQPRVAVVYSSGNGSGVMGKGFDLQYGSRITIDTRWGLPRYDGEDEYLLDGVKLSRSGVSGTTVTYRPERESGFELIERYGSGGAYYWVVTDRTGRRRTYGASAGSRIGRSAAERYVWELEEEQDVYGNTVTYEYRNDGNRLQIHRIRYTGNVKQGLTGLYTVEFGYTTGRTDVQTDGRGRYLSEQVLLLERITLAYDGQAVRSYYAEYGSNYFGIPELKRFGQEKTGATEADRYLWSYGFAFTEPEKNGETLVFFGAPEEWAMPNGLQVRQGVSGGGQSSVSAGGGVGTSVADVRGTGGLTLATGNGDAQSRQTLVDLDGDGRPDSIKKVGSRIEFYRNTGSGFVRTDDWPIVGGSIDMLEKERSSSTSLGKTVYAGAGALSSALEAGVSYSETDQDGWTDAKGGFVDIDGDGLVDYAEAGAGYYFKNTGRSFVRTAYTSNGVVIPPRADLLSEEQRTKYEEGYYQQSPLRSWRAPYTGSLEVRQTARTDPESPEPVSGDGITAKTYFGAAEQPEIRLKLEPGTETVSDTRQYEARERESIYFLGDPGTDTRGDTILWDITLRYENIRYFADMDKGNVYLPPKTITDAGFGSGYGSTKLPDIYELIYTESSSDDGDDGTTYTCTLKSEWEREAGSEYYTVAAQLVKDKWFIPGWMSPAGFAILWNHTETDEEKITLCSLYGYDPGKNRYYFNENSRIRLGSTWESQARVIQTLIEKRCTEAEVRALAYYTMPWGQTILPAGIHGKLGYEQSGAKKDHERQAGNPGYVHGSGDVLDLDIYEGKLLQIDLVPPYAVRHGGEVFGYGSVTRDGENVSVDIPITQQITVQGVPTESLLYTQGYTYTNYEGAGKIITAAELDAIWADLRGPEYDSRHSRWQSLTYAELTDVMNGAAVADAAVFRAAYDRIVPDAYAATPELAPDTECTFIQKSLSDAERTEVDGVLKGYSWNGFMATDVPFYVRGGSPGIYVMTGDWNDIVDMKDSARENYFNGKSAEEKARYELLYDRIIHYSAVLHLESWRTVQRSIRYYADSRYGVSAEPIKVSYLSDDGETYLNTYINLGGMKLEWNSGDDFSTANAAVPPYSVTIHKKLGEDEDSTVEPEVVDVLYGGVHSWYYGIWVGDQAKNRFSEARLYQQRNENSIISEEEAEAKRTFYNKKKENLENNPQLDDTAEIIFLPVSTRKDEHNQNMISRDDDSGRAITDGTLIGPISNIVTNEMVESSNGTVTVQPADKEFCPYIQGTRVHTNRVGGTSYYDIPGMTNELGGSEFTMVNIQESVNTGTDTVYNASLKLPDLPFSDWINIFRTITLYVEKLRSLGNILALGLGGSNSWGTNAGTTVMRQSVQDINGDGIADVLQYTNGGIRVTPGGREGYTGSYPMANGKELSKNTNTLTIYGAAINPSGSAKVGVSPSGRITDITVTGSAGTGYTGSEGTSIQEAALMDINGDGLPDYVSGSTVRLNLGDGFSDSRSIGAQLRSSTVQSIGGSFSLSSSGGGKSSNSTANGSSTGFSLGVGGAINYSVTGTETTVMMMDINGDGLPDKVRKDGSSNTMTVQFNLGKSFSSPRTVEARDWGLGSADKNAIDTKTDGNLLYGAIENLPVIGSLLASTSMFDPSSGNYANPYSSSGKLNSLELSTSVSLGISGSLNANINIPIQILWLTINITTAYGGGVNAGTNLTGISVRTMDMDGDGLPDRVLRIPGSEKIYVQRNLGGEVGLLKAIDLPQGGRTELAYEWIYGTTAAPQTRCVLREVVTTDGTGQGIKGMPEGAHRYTVRYQYSADGYYDRAVKEFYGYETVTETRYRDEGAVQADTIKTTVYYNDAYYRKGMVKQVTLQNAEGTVRRTTEYHIDAAPFARILSEDTELREQDGSTVTTKTEYTYETVQGYGYGNVIRMVETGGPGTNPIRAEISYNHSLSGYLHAHPAEIKVYGGANSLLRWRTAEYDTETGALKKITQYQDRNGTGKSVSTVDWDGYGNLRKITDPNGAWIQYSYDGDYTNAGEADSKKQYQYPVRIERGGTGTGTYTSTIGWDKRYGLRTLEVDENGNRMEYVPDEYGRLAEVWSPYDHGGSTPAVRYQYSTEAGTNWYAVTENRIRYDLTDNPSYDPVMVTVVMLDGLGRGLITAKNGEYRADNGTDISGWNVSGLASYDGKGRTIAEGQIRFIAGNLETLLANPLSDSLKNPVRTTYDGLDRPVVIEFPDPSGPARQYTAYGIGNGLSYAVTTDPKGNATREERDSRGNILTVTKIDQQNTILTRATYEYNELGEMLRALDYNGNPLTVEYDLLGRRTAMQSRDMGRKEYHYDNAGNLVLETDTVLRDQGMKIEYEYDGLNRLTAIQYPSDVSGRTKYWYGLPGAGSNSAGRVTKIEDASGSITYTYGKLGQVVEETRTIGLLPASRNETKTKSMAYAGNYLGQMERIEYPDGEVVRYEYNSGGQIRSVTGKRGVTTYPYVKDIGYDEYGQRRYIRYGNDVETWYTYQAERRWLDGIETKLGIGSAQQYQNITYDFDTVGNVKGYENRNSTYSTAQSYEYDNLYQLTKVTGTSTNELGTRYEATYQQTYRFNEIGNMVNKKSVSGVSNGSGIGSNLNYEQSYQYYDGYAHRVERIGNRYYQYDGNGNVVIERDNGHAEIVVTDHPVYEDGHLQYTEYGFALQQPGVGTGSESVYQRVYTWNERNQLLGSKDNRYTVQYRYGADGERVVKYVEESGKHTLYYNRMWQMNSDGQGWRQSKHVYVGDTRVVTKRNYEGESNPGYEQVSQYWYHGDHLGSAQAVTDYNGVMYERLEYTPYGEVWIEERGNGEEGLPFRFTGKEMDEETGLYYYGARYLDPKMSRWLSTDPAMGEYVPGAPVNEEVRKRNGNLPGMGGVYNYVNLHTYHYAGNNPVKYTDPDGMEIKWARGEGVSDKQFERIQKIAEQLKASGTEAGNRFLEMDSNTKHTVTIHVTADLLSEQGGGYTVANSEYGARNETIGSGTDVYISAKGPLINRNKVLGARLAHEVSGHAYDNYNGTSIFYSYLPGLDRETIGRTAAEEYAVGIENEYRDFIGLKQRDSYYIPGYGKHMPMPIYDGATGTYSVNR